MTQQIRRKFTPQEQSSHPQATLAGRKARVRRLRFPWPETQPVHSLAEGIFRKRRHGFREDGQANGTNQPTL